MAIGPTNLRPAHPGQPRTAGTAPDAVPGDFARLLKGAGEPPRAAGPVPATASAPRGPDAGKLHLPKLAEFSPQRLAEFAERFRAKLAASGIGLTIPVELDVAPDGSITVSGHPDAGRIRDLLAEDPALSNEYRALAAQSALAAQAKIAAAYTRDWCAAATDGDRMAVWGRYSGLAEQLSHEAGGRMTIGPRGAVSAAMEFVRARGLG